MSALNFVSSSCNITASNRYRNIYLNSALHVLKGAACVVFQLPVARSTKKIQFAKDNQGVLTIGSINEYPTEAQIEHFNVLISQKLNENALFRVIVVDRSIAEKKYGEVMYDEFGVPKSITQLRLVLLEEWNINANTFPVLKSTGLIGKILIEKFSFIAEKSMLKIHFKVSREDINEAPAMKKREEESYKNLQNREPCTQHTISEGETNDKELIALEEALSENELPSFIKVIPPSGVENYKINDENDSDVVTPWEVGAKNEEQVNYDKLLLKFGCSKIEERHIKQIEELTGTVAHHLLRRGLFFSHRDLDLLLNVYRNGFKFYLYSGRGPSSEALHIGHLIPFLLTKYLQEAFDVPLVIQLTDDEKFLFKESLGIEEVHRLAYENAKDIIACGFKLEKTFIFSDLDYIKQLYPLALQIQKKVSYNQCRAIFGFTENDNIGKSTFPSIQAAPSFAKAFPYMFGKNPQNVYCLIPQAIDQDPYFRMTRDVASRLGLLKPSLIHSKFIPSLQGFKTKMSGSTSESCILLTDSPQTIKDKIFKYAFSGGGATVEEHRQKGANLEIDVSYQYLTFLLEDDEELKNIGEKYSRGEMLTGEVKQILVDVLTKLTQEHQERRKLVTDDIVKQFMDPTRPELKMF